jgi:hypothetical protein
MPLGNSRIVFKPDILHSPCIPSVTTPRKKERTNKNVFLKRKKDLLRPQLEKRW